LYNNIKVKSFIRLPLIDTIIMEPTFLAVVAVNTVTAELQSQPTAAVAALPPSHCVPPTEREFAASKEAAYTHLQDWAFTKGFALVTQSSKTEGGVVNRVIYACIHHAKKTRNTCKTAEEDRKRVETKTQANSCPFRLYISLQKKLGGWGIGSTNLEHNYPPNPDPFQYIQHRDKRPGYAKAVVLAASHRGIVSYKE
jgi:hypothetical protein